MEPRPKLRRMCVKWLFRGTAAIIKQQKEFVITIEAKPFGNANKIMDFSSLCETILKAYDTQKGEERLNVHPFRTEVEMCSSPEKHTHQQRKQLGAEYTKLSILSHSTAVLLRQQLF